MLTIFFIGCNCCLHIEDMTSFLVICIINICPEFYYYDYLPVLSYLSLLKNHLVYLRVVRSGCVCVHAYVCVHMRV